MRGSSLDYTVPFTSVRWHTACALLPAGSGMLRREGRKQHVVLTFAVMGCATRDPSLHGRGWRFDGRLTSTARLDQPNRFRLDAQLAFRLIPPPHNANNMR